MLKSFLFILTTAPLLAQENFFSEQPEPAVRAQHAYKRRHFVKFEPRLIANILSRFRRPGFNPGIQLNLFDDARYSLILDRPEFKGGDRMTLYGHLAEAPGSLVILVHQKGILQGFVYVPDRGTFQIRYAGGGLHEVYEDAPQDKSFEGGEDILQPPPAAAGQPAEGQPLWVPENYPAGCPYATNQPILDIMVLYTASALAWAGGTTVAMQNLIDLGVAYINMSYFNSGVTAQMRVVYEGEEAYTDSGSVNVDLTRLQNPADGYMDDAPVKRDTYGADLVALLTGPPDARQGYGYFAYSGGTAYQDLAYTCTSVDFVIPGLAHETGHNLGCDHNSANAAGTPAFGYSYGWYFTAQGVVYGDIMSYVGKSIPYYSSPLVTYKGIATGVANAADNARTINNTAPVEANFRPASSVNAFPAVSLTYPTEGAVFSTPVTLTLTANASDSDGTITQVDFFADSTYLGTSTSSPYSFVWNLVPDGPHFIVAHAIDDKGAIQYSCPVSIQVASTLPPPWVSQDVGPVSLMGSASANGGVFTVNGSGGGIGAVFSTDQLQYTYQQMCGNGSLTARITSLQPAATNAQSGVLMRDTFNDLDPFAMVSLSANGQTAFIYRDAQGNNPTQVSGPLVALPYWVRLTRTGMLYQGFVSPDGATWTSLGAGVSVVMPTNTSLAGMAASSRSVSQLGSAVFDNVSLTQSCVAPTFTPTFTSTNTRTPTATPTATFTFTVTPTPTFTFTATNSPTPTFSFTATNSFTATATFTNSFTGTPTFTSTPTDTPTLTPTNSFTPTNTNRFTNNFSPTPTWTMRETPSFTVTDSPTPSFTGTPTNSSTPSFTATRTWTGTDSFTPTSTLTLTYTGTPTPTPTSSGTFTDSPTLTLTFTSTATDTSTPTYTATSTNSFTPTSTSSSSSTFTPTYSSTPTASPTFTPSYVYTSTPSVTPTAAGNQILTYQVVFPNPASGGQVTFGYGLGRQAQRVSFKLFTTAFRKVAAFTGPIQAGDNRVTFDINSFANGLYYFLVLAEVDGRTEQKVGKLIVSR